MSQYLLPHETPAACAGIGPEDMGVVIERDTARATALDQRGVLGAAKTLIDGGSLHQRRGRNAKALAGP